MNWSRFRSPLLIPAVLILILGNAGCKNADTTTAPGSLARVAVNAPKSAQSGSTFQIDVTATSAGINNLHNGQVTVTVPAPLSVVAVDTSPGTSATFSSGPGATVTWMLFTLDSNTQSALHITATGGLPAGSGTQSLAIQAMLTADGVPAGEAIADDTVQLTP